MIPRKIVYLSAILAVLALMPAVPTVRASQQLLMTQPSQSLTYLDSSSMSPPTSDTGASDNASVSETNPASSLLNLIPHSGVNAAHVPAKNIPMPTANAIVTSNPGLVAGFNALSHRNQRLAGTGKYVNTQFSLEPPDQALCVGTAGSSGSTVVLESINTALRVFSISGTPLTATTAINQFFKLAPEVIRTTPRIFGNFTSDPKCYFDAATSSWFLTLVEIDANPSTGASGPRSHELIAVTGNPTGTWNLFSFDVSDDGTNGTPSHPNCPCFGDQPLIGADANGFYISTNEFSISLLNGLGGSFNGAQIYAISKSALATASSGSLPAVVHIDASQALVPFGGLSFSIQPATTPPGGSFQSNTEFFLSSLDFSSTTDNRIAVWALTNTASLTTSTPNVSLSFAVISSEVYGQPPAATQQKGPFPLGQSLGEKLELLNSNDDRMNQVVFANGLLWAGVNTVVQVPGDVPTTVGIAYFIVSPTLSSSGSVGGSVVKQGYVAAFGASVMFPSIGVNPLGQGIIGFTLVGPSFFPSAAYAPVDAVNGAGDIHISGAGQLPEDGFTGYHFFGSPDRVARWGDYSAAVADSSGNIWMGVEYIPNAPRTLFANWGTFISQVSP
jgi:hypothetical protein